MMPFDPKDFSNPRTKEVGRVVQNLIVLPQGDIEATQAYVTVFQNILLSDDADAMISALIDGLLKIGNETALNRVAFMRETQRLLRRSRQIGIHPAFLEFKRQKGW